MSKRTSVVVLCVVVALLAWGGAAWAGGHWAVVCGIADYKQVNDLTYTVNDAKDMADALKQHAEWSQTADQIVLLLNSSASKAGVKAAIEAMGRKAANDPDAVCIFFFSGHGTQVRDASGEERDRYDEAICPWDTSSAATSVITDDELASWLATNLPSQHVVCILDTCFSGGAAKGVKTGKGVQAKTIAMPGVAANAKPRRAMGFHVAQRLATRRPQRPAGPWAWRPKPPSGGGGGGSSIPSQDIGGTNSVVLMACQEGGYSYETGALQNGVFTYFILQGLGIAGSKPPADTDGDGAVSAEEAHGYAAPKTTSYSWSFLRAKQTPRLYDGNPYAEVELFAP